MGEIERERNGDLSPWKMQEDKKAERLVSASFSARVCVWARDGKHSNYHGNYTRAKAGISPRKLQNIYTLPE